MHAAAALLLLATAGAPTRGGGWRPGAAQFANTMSVTTVVQTQGKNQSSGTLRALVGGQQRGWRSTVATPTFGPFANQSLYLMLVHGDRGGETVRFEHADLSGRTTALVQTVEFQANDIVGDAVSPLVLTDG